jgi:3,4-dihydroxy 2-butanone 4-phosphate synthase
MLDEALNFLKTGQFVLLHDSSDRENEVDMVIAAKYVMPKHIAQMRQFAGGLICIAVDDVISENIRLEYLHESLMNYTGSPHKEMVYKSTKYGDHPSFSMWINHVETKTGITDMDRALTANEMARLAEIDDQYQLNYFTKMFKTPGHVPLLKSAPGLIKTRQGHTEMSTHLLKMASVSPVSVICEMMDPDTHHALSVEKATKFANANNIPMIDCSEVIATQNIYA